MNLLHHSSDTRAMAWRVEEHVSIDLLLDQNSSSSSQSSARRQWPPVSESAANQNASINKDSKSSNSRSLRQHTLAKSISLCCFDFYFVLRNRSFHHTNLQISSASIEVKILNKILNKILILAAFAYIFYLRLLLRIFCFRIYLFTSIASAMDSSASIMTCHAIYASVNGSLCNVDR